MAEVPPRVSSVLPYIWAALIFFLMGIVLILAILFIRPTVDPLVLIAAVFGVIGTMFTSAAAFLKSQETHLTVNSQLTAWKAEFFEMAHAQGVIAGADKEQARVAEQKRLLALSAAPSATPGAATVTIPATTTATPS